jgi:hypothetical protein
MGAVAFLVLFGGALAAAIGLSYALRIIKLI